ncbi:MAG: alpha-amylase family glycosyl hydrolase [Candidatus Izemoplasmatales bacterium]
MKKNNISPSIFEQREADWRNGSIIYQVLVDRFAPTLDLESKKELYAFPKTLKSWSETPRPGHFVKEVGYWSHELEYWGGDLASLKAKLDYIKNLGVQGVYLNPIVDSLSNHKYDASDYLKISKEYGTMEDLYQLTEEIHHLGMKIVLDGVFNHVGVTSPLFLEAKDPLSKKHDWFDFNDLYPSKVRMWADTSSLPELNLENPEVRDYIYKAKDSVIRSYLRNGIDGWRLDVAFDIGFEYLKELTTSAHLEKPSSIIIGEIWNYPRKWLKSIDGVMNFTFREIILKLIRGDISPRIASEMFNNVITNSGIEGILKSWNLLDNHDTPRLSSLLPNVDEMRLARVLQFTLPGSPNLYYGSELGMDGVDDPMNRAPMRWDLVSETNEELNFTKLLIQMHNHERALRIGDYEQIVSEKLTSFIRRTDEVSETIIVVVNPTENMVEDTLLVPDSRLMNYSGFISVLGDQLPKELKAALLSVKLKPKSFMVVKPQTQALKSYTCYKRV